MVEQALGREKSSLPMMLLYKSMVVKDIWAWTWSLA